MKNVTSTLIATALVSGMLFSSTTMAVEQSTDAKQQLVQAIGSTVSQQANELFYGAKAEILASVQQQLQLSILAMADKVESTATTMMADTAEGISEEVQTAASK